MAKVDWHATGSIKEQSSPMGQQITEVPLLMEMHSAELGQQKACAGAEQREVELLAQDCRREREVGKAVSSRVRIWRGEPAVELTAEMDKMMKMR